MAELEVFESVARRYQLIEASYAQALRDADAGPGGTAWLDERQLYLGHARSRGHALVSPGLEAWVSERLRDESAVLKEARKSREEREAARGSRDATGTGDGGNPRGRGRGRGK